MRRANYRFPFTVFSTKGDAIKAVIVSALGSADVWPGDAASEPVAGLGPVVVRVRAPGINHAETRVWRTRRFV
jgi:NADPH:quinone reductase-like Zn-dependent oxidoreductase